MRFSFAGRRLRRGHGLLVGAALVFALVVTGAVPSGCSASNAGGPAVADIPTPLDTAGPRNVDGPSNSIDLARFSPLLTSPELVQVHQAVEERAYADAAEAYAEMLNSSKSRGETRAAERFLLGRLQRLAEDAPAAARSFEQAAEHAGPLEDYARFYAGQQHLAAGSADQALPLLTPLPSGQPYSNRAALLVAEALLARGRAPEAVARLRPLLSTAVELADWSLAELLLARALLRQAGDEAPGVGSAKPVVSGATGEASPTETASVPPREQLLIEALGHARTVSLKASGSPRALLASQLEQRILAAMPKQLFKEHQKITPEQQVVRAESLLQARKYKDIDAAIQDVGPPRKLSPALRCRLGIVQAKVDGFRSRWGKAADRLSSLAPRCADSDVKARALYLAGKYSQFDKRYSNAVRWFQRLEEQVPHHRLADDARLRRAHCHREMGDESRFTGLLSTMAADYPNGDMVLDGTFQLALRRMERGDWSSAAHVLEGVLPLADAADPSRDHEYAGRERYYLARAWLETGDQARAIQGLEAIIRTRPLSYYMQHAYARLEKLKPGRAQTVRDEALAQAEDKPFVLATGTWGESESFRKAVELMRVGELHYAQQELLGSDKSSSQDTDAKAAVLWSIALLYSQAGADSASHRLARGRLTDWLGRWPVGDWRRAWLLLFPRPYEQLVQKAAAKNGVPEALIYAVMREESGFQPDAVSPAKAYGLMQLIRSTAKHFAKKEGIPYSPRTLTRPDVNIALGSRALSSFRSRFPANPLLAVPGYNAGPGRPKRWVKERPHTPFDLWVELIPFRETRRYTKRVLSSYGAYLFLYAERAQLMLPEGLSVSPEKAAQL